MSGVRHTASSITDNALDALYANATKGWRRGDKWKARAKKAEAALERVSALCDELDEYARVVLMDDTAVSAVAVNIRTRLAEPEENSTP